MWHMWPPHPPRLPRCIVVQGHNVALRRRKLLFHGGIRTNIWECHTEEHQPGCIAPPAPLSPPHLQGAWQGGPESQKKFSEKLLVFSPWVPNMLPTPLHENGQNPAPKALEENWGLFFCKNKRLNPSQNTSIDPQPQISSKLHREWTSRNGSKPNLGHFLFTLN